VQKLDTHLSCQTLSPRHSSLRKATHRRFVRRQAVAFVDRDDDDSHLVVVNLVNESVAKRAQLDLVAADKIRM
jgi:hypothetical protein